MDRKSIVAILLCVVFYVGYESYLNQKYPQRFKRETQKAGEVAQPSQTAASANLASTGVVGSEPALAGSQAESEEASLRLLSQAELTLSNDVATYRFSQQDGALVSVLLKDYASDDRQGPIQLLDAPLRIQGHLSPELSSAVTPYHAERKGQTLELSKREGAWLITQSFTIPAAGHGADIRFTWQNLGTSAAELQSYVLLSENIAYAAKSGGFLPGVPSGRPAILYNIGHKSSWQDLQDYCQKDKDLLAQDSQELDFIGFDRHYFLKLLLPASKKTSFRVERMARSENSCEIKQWLWLKQGLVPAGGQISESYKAWFGPKTLAMMEPYDIRLSETLDLGVFSALSRPLFAGLNYLQRFLGNWGLAIIALTLLLKLLLYPLARQAAMAQNRMKKLQPELNRIKEKYKDDPRLQQQELMRFMGANKVNPLKGCLPILPQIPVFYAFYRVLSTSIELRHAPFFGWIQDLSVADPYYITPLILGLTMFVQQKMMPTTGLDKSQERIMMMLPLVFTIMMLTLPAGMVLYMLTNTVVSIGQQQWLSKKLK